jgi:hypothetical protein
MTDPRLSERPKWRTWVVFLMAWAIAMALAALYVRRGWVPHDEGTLAQSAERLLNGELPHRDFDEIYTGGLSVVHALAFRLFGESLVTMRIPLFAAFGAFLGAVFYIAGRFVGSAASALVMLVAAAWTLPNYSAPIPSWYNLFFATLGTAALLRYLEDPRRRWLAAAGVAGGLSTLAKTPGLYFVAAVVVFLLVREHFTWREAHGDASTRTSQSGWYTTLSLAAIATLALAVALLVRERAGIAGFISFVAPVAVWLAAIGTLLWSARGGPSGARWRALFRLMWPFAAAVTLPILAFTLPYALSGSVGALWTGVFVLPMKRFTFASMDLLPLWTWAYGAAVVALFWAAQRFSANARQWVAVLVAIVVLALLLRSRYADPYETVWYAARSLLPLSVLAGAVLLARTRGGVTPLRQQQLVLLLGVTGLCALVQFPFAAPVYFLYVGPLALLSAVAVARTWDSGAQPAGGVLLLFALLFAVLRINPGFIYAMGVNYARDRQNELLPLARAGLRVTPEDKSTYTETVAAARLHARGDYIWAGPDAPEMYFLAAKKNPTRTLFDFFDAPAGRTSRLLHAIDSHEVNVIVLHSRPPFSGPLPQDLRDSLMRRFPRSETHGWFETRWRE